MNLVSWEEEEEAPERMSTSGGFQEVFVTVCLSVVIGVLSLGSYLYGLIRYGPSVWLSVKKRNDRPDLLDSDAFGRHHWTALKVKRRNHLTVYLNCISFNAPCYQ